MTLEPSANLGALRRRHEAAARCPLLDDGRRDPLEPEPPDISERELDAWARALAHLHSVDLSGLPPAAVRRAMAACGDRYAAVLPRRPAA